MPKIIKLNDHEIDLKTLGVSRKFDDKDEQALLEAVTKIQSNLDLNANAQWYKQHGAYKSAKEAAAIQPSTLVNSLFGTNSGVKSAVVALTLNAGKYIQEAISDFAANKKRKSSVTLIASVLVGVGIGAALGTFAFPVIGTAVGGILGGVIGTVSAIGFATVAGFIMGKFAKKILSPRLFKDEKNYDLHASQVASAKKNIGLDENIHSAINAYLRNRKANANDNDLGRSFSSLRTGISKLNNVNALWCAYQLMLLDLSSLLKKQSQGTDGLETEIANLKAIIQALNEKHINMANRQLIKGQLPFTGKSSHPRKAVYETELYNLLNHPEKDKLLGGYIAKCEAENLNPSTGKSISQPASTPASRVAGKPSSAAPAQSAGPSVNLNSSRYSKTGSPISSESADKVVERIVREKNLNARLQINKKSQDSVNVTSNDNQALATVVNGATANNLIVTFTGPSEHAIIAKINSLQQNGLRLPENCKIRMQIRGQAPKLVEFNNIKENISGRSIRPNHQ